jgi:hypothetical protein
MSKTLQGYRFGLLNWYDHPISTGPLEGINNKIGALQRKAYGYRNYEHFKERLLTLHHAKFGSSDYLGGLGICRVAKSGHAGHQWVVSLSSPTNHWRLQHVRRRILSSFGSARIHTTGLLAD